jgi:hypothetical protein
MRKSARVHDKQYWCGVIGGLAIAKQYLEKIKDE